MCTDLSLLDNVYEIEVIYFLQLWNEHVYVVACSYHYFVTDSGVTIGAVVGGILLLIIIVLLLLIIIILLYENKSSKGRLDITNTSVAYKAVNLDLGASDNVVIKPNPTYHPVK